MTSISPEPAAPSVLENVEVTFSTKEMVSVYIFSMLCHLSLGANRRNQMTIYLLSIRYGFESIPECIIFTYPFCFGKMVFSIHNALHYLVA